MADTGNILVMPKAAIQNADGQLNPTGRNLIAALVDRVSVPPAGSAEEFLVGGKALIRSEALWQSMEAAETTGSGNFTPNLGSRLDFKHTLSGPTTILFPSNIPGDGDVLPFFSIEFTQDSVGGHTVDYGSGYRGQNPVILTAAGDITLVGFKVRNRSPDEFYAWAVKAVLAGT